MDKQTELKTHSELLVEIEELRAKNETLEKDLIDCRKALSVLSQKSKLWQYLESRFVIVDECTPETKDKCLMFSEMLCEGERCKRFIDVESLIDKAIEKDIVS